MASGATTIAMCYSYDVVSIPHILAHMIWRFGKADIRLRAHGSELYCAAVEQLASSEVAIRQFNGNW